MGQTLEVPTCKSVEGCCKQHVFPNRASDTVKVDVTLLQQQPPQYPVQQKAYCSAGGGKENAEPHKEDCPRPSGPLSCTSGSSPSATPAVKPSPAAAPTQAVRLRSWEAGWLGADFQSTPQPQPLAGDSLSWFESAPHSLSATTLADQTAQFALPNEDTPVLTGLLEADASSPAPWAEMSCRSSPSSEAGLAPTPTTPTTSAGRSTPGGSPATYRLLSPSISLGCRSSETVSPTSRVVRQVSVEEQEARMQEAQTLLASMLSPGQTTKERSKRRRSEPPPPAALAAPNSTLAAERANGTNVGRRSLSCKPRARLEHEFSAEASAGARLQPLNGRMPQFPPADLNSHEQQALAQRRKQLPMCVRAAG